MLSTQTPKNWAQLPAYDKRWHNELTLQRAYISRRVLDLLTIPPFHIEVGHAGKLLLNFIECHNPPFGSRDPRDKRNNTCWSLQKSNQMSSWQYVMMNFYCSEKQKYVRIWCIWCVFIHPPEGPQGSNLTSGSPYGPGQAGEMVKHPKPFHEAETPAHGGDWGTPWRVLPFLPFLWGVILDRNHQSKVQQSKEWLYFIVG